MPTLQEIALRLSLAVVAGGVLGFERQWHRKPAGLRTHMMVSLGAATFVLVAFRIFVDASGAHDETTRLDPLRVIEGLVGGIGFLGAGTILRNEDTIEGLTTATSVWISGALGAACGAGHYHIAGVAVGLGLVVLMVLGAMEHHWHHEDD